MKDTKFDKQLAAARHVDAKHPSKFTQDVMAKIHTHETLRASSRIKDKQTIRSLFMKYINTHTKAAIFVLALTVGSVGFTGYAYASTGTDPITFISRWITGQTVNVEYEGRQFEHGVYRDYSDAAITAFAEMNTVEALHFHAANRYQIPKNGIEHVSPARVEYQYPWLATVERVDDQNVQLKKRYTFGDKTTPSKTEDTVVTMPISEFSFYEKGEPAVASAATVGKVVVMFTGSYLRHTIGSHQPAVPVTHYFMFQLSHSIESIIEAKTPRAKADTGEANVPLYEPKWGGMSNICLNNGTDTCKLASKKATSLYGESTTNPLAAKVYEGYKQKPTSLMLRGTEGKVSAITNDNIQITSSSGAVWTIGFALADQQHFTKISKQTLKVGDTVSVSLIASPNDLDIRTFDRQHIYSLEKQN